MKNEPPTHVLGLAHPPIPVVRIGLIGLGNRGLLTLERYMLIEHVEIKALCEIRPGNLAKGQALLTKGGHPAATGYAGENGWQQMCCNPDIDLIIICTDWLTHAPMATYAMEQGKHVAIEVPAAMTVAECWQLVDTAERTRRHCIMLENCCYDAFALTTLNMARQGLFGESCTWKVLIYTTCAPCTSAMKTKAVSITTGTRLTVWNTPETPIPLTV